MKTKYTNTKKYIKKDGTVKVYVYDYRKYNSDRQKYDDKRFICECGSDVKYYDKNKHLKTKKCVKFFTNKMNFIFS